MICGNKITWKYTKGSLPILKDVSFQLRKGRMTIFMGQSGAGKTTLLKCVANLHSQYEGIITCEGKDIKRLNHVERASSIGFVHQQFHLFPHFNVLKNCTYALGMEKAEESACAMLKVLGLLPFIDVYPSQLSGGQQQRVAIARALLLRPKILLLDEPTSALDPESKRSLELLLLDLKNQGMTLALSSHDMPFIRRMMDYVYFMEQGALIEEWDGEKEDLSSKEKIKQFLSHG